MNKKENNSIKINSSYFERENIKLIKENFIKNRVIKLDDFLDKKSYGILSGNLKNLTFIAVKKPDKYSFALATTSSGLMKELDLLFCRYLSSIMEKEVKFNLQIKRFSHTNYIIIHDEEFKSKKTVYEFVFYLAGKWDFDMGGNKVLRGKKNYVITPLGNSLVLTKLENGTNSFSQYINYKAGKNSFMVIEGTN